MSAGDAVSQPASASPKLAASPGATLAGTLDDESRRWVDALAATGYARDDAVARLHELLLRAARFEIARRRVAVPHLGGSDREDLAQQAADDALVAILAKLASFRGDSRFTTWAYKFALYEAAVKLRRRAWQDRELPLEPDTWPEIASRALSPADHAAEHELLVALQHAIRSSLSDHQREVLVAVTLNGVPIDVLAERLNTTRGALYKTLHDARRKLRARLADDGHDPITDAGRHEP
jgi:RNA polymerase sigma-70 factor, ECF subfamily